MSLVAVFLLAAAAAAIDYPSVAAARKALEARDGQDAIVTHPDGWTVVNEPAASAQWTFTHGGHPAHPAVVRRLIKRDGREVSVETTLLCEAPQAACDKLRTEFEAMNDRIVQSVKARGRMPPPPAR